MGFSVNRRNSLRSPACAGKSKLLSARRGCGWDHPRVCGEKKTLCRSRQPCSGSPPRVRGKVARRTPTCQAEGITPACAGKSIVLFLDDLVQQDHPRVCGEKRRSAPSGRPRWGSPPRVRGKACPFGLALALSRITPACAGKRLTSFTRFLPQEDHPRVCGEK